MWLNTPVATRGVVAKRDCMSASRGLFSAFASHVRVTVLRNEQQSRRSI